MDGLKEAIAPKNVDVVKAWALLENAATESDDVIPRTLHKNVIFSKDFSKHKKKGDQSKKRHQRTYGAYIIPSPVNIWIIGDPPGHTCQA